jgi:SRSO17 transposase
MTLAMALPARSWRTIRWREGTRGTMRSRFAAVTIRAAHRDEQRSQPRAEEWLLIEWPKGESEPTKFWLSTVPQEASLEDFVRLSMLRWRIKRDFGEMKGELGLGRYEGRNWLGFHHMGFCALPHTPSSPPSALGFPPLRLLPSSSPLRYPEVSV